MPAGTEPPRDAVALPPLRIGRPAPPDILENRRAAAASARAKGCGRGSIVQSIDGVRVLRFQPSRASRGTVIHLHGGGFRQGCPETVGAFAATLAEHCSVEVVCPAYRLAPEHPFPAGLADAQTILSAIRREGHGPVIVSGDSAGGGLAAGLALLAMAQTAPPAGVMLLSPWLDLACENPCYQINAASDPLFSFEKAKRAADLYLQGISPRHPLASPLFAPLSGFPPCFIGVGADEVLAGDSLAFCRSLREAGGVVTLVEISRMEHIAVARSLSLPGAAETFGALAAFVTGLVSHAST